MLKLRKAVQRDIPVIRSMIRELAEYEREPNAVHSSEKSLRQDMFGPNPIIHALFAEWSSEAAGMALYYYYYSTWAGRRGIFLEDLFVRPKFRGKGVGKALMTKLAQIAVAENCYGLRWEVLDWNKPAIEFYQHLNSESRTSWKVMQLRGEGLKRLAAAKADFATARTE